MSTPTIYVLYNAKASVLGKLDYARRKLSAPESSSPCAACDLTHGGLRLSESALWKDTRERVDAHFEQQHQDELTSNVSYAPNVNIGHLLIARTGCGVHEIEEHILSCNSWVAQRHPKPFD